MVILSEFFYYLFWRQSGTQGSLTGVGLSIGYPAGSDGSPAGLVVISAAPGGPANRAGILSGDILLSIDNVSTDNMGIYDAAERLQWVFILYKVTCIYLQMNYFFGIHWDSSFLYLFQTQNVKAQVQINYNKMDSIF